MIKNIIFGLISFSVFSQDYETVINSDFTIRDFIIHNDSVTFIKKRNIYSQDLSTKSSNNYFIGGYGLELYYLASENTIISTSNELVNNVSSVRFYNKKEKRVENVFYYRGGKIIDFLITSEINTFVLSLTNNKIIFINFEDRPKFLKTIELDLDSKSRRLIFQDKTLFFITDNGEIYKYSLEDNIKQLVYKCNDVITDFFVNNELIIYSTIDGKLVKINRVNKKESVLLIENNFILNSLEFEKNNALICGSWNGTIYEIDLKNFLIKNEMRYHKRSVLKISKGKENTFYSSGLDKTIKKWKLN